MDTSGQKRPTTEQKRSTPQHKGLTTDRRKPRRSRPNLGALSSLVSFDGPEGEDSKRDSDIELRSSIPAIVSKTPRTGQEKDHEFMKVPSAPYSPSTLGSQGIPSLRKTLSQDWLKSSFSPRPGKEAKRDLLWHIDSMRSPQRLFSNIPSLRSIPEDSELDRDEGSELSDDNIQSDGLSRPTSSSSKSVEETRADNEKGAFGSDDISKA